MKISVSPGETMLPTRIRLRDAMARAGILVAFSYLAFTNLVGVREVILRWSADDSLHQSLAVAAKISNALFLGLVAATALTRLKPIRKSKGLRPRLFALLGTFLCTTLALLEPAKLPPFWSALSSALTIIGTLLAFVVLRWLGRSFSIMAEARALVTTGPYTIVRHPLYVCEAIAALGMLIQMVSPAALLILGAYLGSQYQRIRNEEKVLCAAFPDYEKYAALTPRLIPALAGSSPQARG